jgi:membrane protease YdiL (CAAX protease family)
VIRAWVRSGRLERLISPPTRRLDELTAGVAGRWRALGEIAWVLAALLGGEALAALQAGLSLPARAQAGVAVVATFGFVVTAYALVRPWRVARRGQRRLAWLLGLGLAPVAALAAVGPAWRAAPAGPRIGVALEDATAAGSRPAARVIDVTRGSPADGRLRSGDLVWAVAGEPLAASGPADDLVARAQSPTGIPAGDVTFSLVRGGEERTVVVPLAAPSRANGLSEAFRATLLRDVALLLWLAALLVAEGLGFEHLGLGRGGWGGELRAAVPALIGLVLAHFVVSILVTGLALAVGGQVLDVEVSRRVEVVGTLLADHLRWTLPLIVVASTTEEIVFRGFLLPRLRVVVGGWAGALVLGAIAFGAGHLYEGTLATVQTTGIGLGLGVIYLWRRRLPACILAHVGFNSLALLLALLVLSMGWLERAQDLLGG